MKKIIYLGLAFALAAALAGCGGGGGGGGGDVGGVSIALTPSSVDVPMNATQSFTAAVTGTSDTSITWKVLEAGGGTYLRVNATTVSYLAPGTPGTYHLRATSNADPTRSATAEITVVSNAVDIQPRSISIPVSSPYTFTGTVSGTTDQRVAWSVREGSTGGCIVSTGQNTGKYYPPGVPGTYHIVATSIADTSKTGTATVTVTQQGVAISIQPSRANVSPGGTQKFTATVTGTSNTGVTWRILEQGTVGTLSNVGSNSVTYNAPQVWNTFHILATSSADPSKITAAEVQVSPALPE